VSSDEESTRVVYDATPGASATIEPLPIELDRYTVLDSLGHGGMGIVVAAYDPELDRTVALKVVRPPRRAGVDRETAQRALLREARAVAALSHPNVVTIFDVGRAGDRVWFAMEHIRGTTLARWLARATPGWRSIVDTFVQAGRGLAAAHHAGLVHGDFKPANVLIGDKGRVVVVDFGLAHPHGADSVSGEHAVDGSGTGFVLGTPMFMAPESLRAGVTDAASDQFAFCVALWQALWRKHPFAADDDDPRTVLARLRAHRRGPPPPRGPVPALVRHVLDRGLSRDPAGRYPDMDELLAALERASTPWRGPWLALAGGAALAVVVVGVSRDEGECADETAPSWNADRRAQIEVALAAVDRGYADDVARRVGDRLDEHARRLATAWTESCAPGNADAEAGRRRRRSCLRDRGDAFDALVVELAAPDAALLDHAIDAVAALPRPESCEMAAASVEGPEIGEPERAVRPELARMGALVGTGRADAAIGLGEALLVTARASDDGPSIAAVLDALANAYESAGRLAEAEQAWTEAVWLARAHGRDDIVELAAISLVSTVGFQQSRPAEGLAWARHAEAALARTGAEDATRAGLHNSLGLAHLAAGDYAAAVAEYEVALALVADRTALDRASILNNLGPALLKQGRFEEARAALVESLAIQEDAFGTTHPKVAGTLGNIGLVAQEQGDHAAALAYLERALAIGEAAYGPDHPTVAFFVNNIAVHHYERGQFELALPMYRRVVAVLERVFGEHPNTALAYGNVGLALVELRRPDEALAMHRRALEMTRTVVGEEHPDFAMVLNNTGSAMRELGELDEARATYERALALRERLLGAEHPLTATTVLNLGLVASLAGDHERARQHATRALAIWESTVGPKHARTGLALTELGAAMLALGDPKGAEPLLQRALDIADTSGTDPIARAEARFALARTHRALGRDADALAREALAIYEAAGPRRATEARELRAFLAD
jgi:eukaryotic-like serine/threonine-protein kinase